MATRRFYRTYPGRYAAFMNGDIPAPGFSRVAVTAIAAAAIAGLSGVVLGAYAAHWAPTELRAGLGNAAIYALIHGLALIATALVHDRAAGAPSACWLLRVSMLAVASGIALFSGGIYLQAGTAPVGGILLMAGWLFLTLGSGTLLFTSRN